ncbi:MAG: Gfo/Idh/MocA family oxidoreductase [Mariniphaga sp.]|nr:Gfo/Idh/MocA family oxidoreductase [Mariniphaga sp.]
MKVNRRKFIHNSAMATTGIGLTSIIPSNVWSSETAPSDKINVALVGCRNMGFGILNHHLSNNDVNCVALCDIDENILNEKAVEIKEKFQQNPSLYKDFRKMLEQKDIDAVIVGTPDHWHCLITVYALQAGKDVYVEKPMANTIEECNIMVKAANHYKKIVQVGQQQRSGFIFKKAMDLIKSGKIGTLRRINIWANFRYGAGSQIVPDSHVPKGIDYDMWLGPAPYRPFNSTHFHGMWRMFWDFGGGLMSDWGVHLIDMGLWAKDITTAPEKVIVYAANTFHEKRSRETFDSMTVCFPNSDFALNWDMTAGIESGPYDMPYGIAFVGDDATIVTNRSKIFLKPEFDNDNNKFKVEEYSYTEGKESHNEHVRNFLDCIKSREEPACPPETGRAAALHVHMANIAGRVGANYLEWDNVKNQFKNNSAANELIVPKYRSPWKLPSI